MKIQVPIGALLVAAALGASCAEDGGEQSCPETPGTICPWAGTGAAGYDGDGHALTATRFYWPADLTFAADGTPYVLDWNNHRVRRFVGGAFETVIGTDEVGDGDDRLLDLTPEGVIGTAIDLNHPTKMLELPDGDFLLVSWHNHKLRRYDPDTGIVNVLCGRGAGITDDGGRVADALLNQPASATLGPDDAVYVVDQRNQRIRRLSTADPDGTITTVVGTGTAGFAGDGGDPLLAQVKFPGGSNPPPAGGIVFDEAGRLYFSDILNQRVRRVDFDANTIETVVGDGTPAQLNNPRDLELGPDGAIYIADERNNRVLRLDVETDTVSVVVGTGATGNEGDFGAATAATLHGPTGIAFDASGDMYIADSQNHRIRRVRGGL